VPLSHTSATFIVAWEPIDLPPGEADIVLTIDEERFERPITLPNGISKTSREAAVLGRDDAVAV